MVASTAVTLLSVSLVALSGAAPTSAEPTPAPVPRLVAERHVVAISVDGLNPDAIRQLGTSRAPSFHRMLDEGAGTLDARTAVEKTVTLPNHTGMLTGRRVLGDRGHHVTMNVDPGGTIKRLAAHYVPSLFDVVHDRGGSTGLYAAKSKFALFDRSWGPQHGRRDTTGADDGRDKIDKFVVDRSDVLVRKVVHNLETSPRSVSFLHLAHPDLAGHAYGFMSPQYLDAVARTDVLLGRILDAIADDDHLRATTDVVLTADHGGRGPGHDDATSEDNYTIPFLTWGVDVAAGEDLYEINTARTDPGHGRPGYGDSPPIRNTDLASLVTALLSMPEVPGGLPHTDPLNVS